MVDIITMEDKVDDDCDAIEISSEYWLDVYFLRHAESEENIKIRNFCSGNFMVFIAILLILNVFCIIH